jgi:galactokinase/mevalonate kinase-like predicted kinase
LGIVLPGLNKHHYDGEYWPSKIISEHNEEILSWIEDHLFLINLGPRASHYNVLDNTNINKVNAQLLAEASEECWNSILKMDLRGFGHAFRASFEAQIKMFPNMMDQAILRIIDRFKDQANGWKLSGAGGGGYLILVSEHEIDRAIKIKVRRNTL